MKFKSIVAFSSLFFITASFSSFAQTRPEDRILRQAYMQQAAEKIQEASGYGQDPIKLQKVSKAVGMAAAYMMEAYAIDDQNPLQAAILAQTSINILNQLMAEVGYIEEIQELITELAQYRQQQLTIGLSRFKIGLGF